MERIKDRRKMTDYIERIVDRTQVKYQVNEGFDEAWENLKQLGLVAITLKGHESTLFKKHQSFNNAQQDFEAPEISKSFPLHKIATIEKDELKSRFQARQTLLLESIFRLKFSDDNQDDENTADKPYLQSVLLAFLPFPPVCYNEVHLEFHSNNHLVGGSYDLVVGSETNGCKPTINIEGIDVAVHLGSLVEAKNTSKKLSTNNEPFTKPTVDLRIIIQPLLEAMAMSEVAFFPEPELNIPIVNFLGNKFVFRPILYFKEIDVAITTPKAVPLRIASNRVNKLGLLVMFIFINVHWHEILKFDTDEMMRKYPMTGWKEARTKASTKATYKNSKFSVAGVKNKFQHENASVYLHSRSSEEEEEEEEQEEEQEEEENPSPAKKSKKVNSRKTIATDILITE